MADTLTVYPDPDPESTSVDGTVRRNVGTPETFAVIRAGDGTAAYPSSTTTTLIQLSHSGDGDSWSYLNRSIFLFDTSQLPDLIEISSAVISLYITANGSPSTDTAHFCTVNPASNTDLANADYGTFGDTSFGSTAHADITINQYNAWTLNASGISAISVSGITKYGFRLGRDLNNDNEGVETTRGSLNGLLADYADTTSDPKLVITYTSSRISQPMAQCMIY